MILAFLCLLAVASARGSSSSSSDKSMEVRIPPDLDRGSKIKEASNKFNTFGEDPENFEDLVFIEDDILVTKEEAAIYKKSGWNGLIKSNAWNPDLATRWSKTIPHKISVQIVDDANFEGTKIEANLKAVIQDFEKQTCVRFPAKKDTDKQYLSFKRSAMGCYSYNGKPKSGRRSIYLNFECSGTEERKGEAAHQILHAMGRYHENNRPDRDDFISIASDNTCPSSFEKHSDALTYHIGYDYYSIMHHNPRQCSACSIGRSSFTILKTGITYNSVGQRKALSKSDIAHVKAVFCPSMMMRLVGGEGSYEGRLEVNDDEVWASVCSSSFNTNEASVVCRYLGHPNVQDVYSAEEMPARFAVSQRTAVWSREFKCTGDEVNPFTCTKNKVKSASKCNDVAIRCFKAARFIDENDDSGRLEVFHEEKWDSVCSHNFGRKEANVACRMMGYSSAVEAYTDRYNDAAHSESRSQFTCKGDESHLSDCEYTHDCPGGGSVFLKCTNCKLRDNLEDNFTISLIGTRLNHC